MTEWKLSSSPNVAPRPVPLHAVNGASGSTRLECYEHGRLVWTADASKILRDFCAMCADHATDYRARRRRDTGPLASELGLRLAEMRARHATELANLRAEYAKKREELLAAFPATPVLTDPKLAAQQAYDAAEFPHRKAAERRKQNNWLEANFRLLSQISTKPRPK